MINAIFPNQRLGVQPDSNAGVPASGGETITDILARASERARQAALEYIGLVTPQEAMHLMEAAGARLVDVRTPNERARSGRIAGSVAIPWHTRAAVELRFVAQLKRRVAADEIALFLSRNGERSHLAATAAAQEGYVHALSVLEGTDGERVGGGRTRGGWRRVRRSRARQAGADSALDEALKETFPASDPIAVDPAPGGSAAPPEAAIDEALEETFPASDPIAVQPASGNRPPQR